MTRGRGQMTQVRPGAGAGLWRPEHCRGQRLLRPRPSQRRRGVREAGVRGRGGVAGEGGRVLTSVTGHDVLGVTRGVIEG